MCKLLAQQNHASLRIVKIFFLQNQEWRQEIIVNQNAIFLSMNFFSICARLNLVKHFCLIFGKKIFRTSSIMAGVIVVNEFGEFWFWLLPGCCQKNFKNRVSSLPFIFYQWSKVPIVILLCQGFMLPFFKKLEESNLQVKII